MIESVSFEKTLFKRPPERFEAGTPHISGAIAMATAEDLVLIAGKGHEDYQILGTQRIHFDDREHAAEVLQKREARASL